MNVNISKVIHITFSEIGNGSEHPIMRIIIENYRGMRPWYLHAILAEDPNKFEFVISKAYNMVWDIPGGTSNPISINDILNSEAPTTMILSALNTCMINIMRYNYYNMLIKNPYDDIWTTKFPEVVLNWLKETRAEITTQNNEGEP